MASLKEVLAATKVEAMPHMTAWDKKQKAELDYPGLSPTKHVFHVSEAKKHLQKLVDHHTNVKNHFEALAKKEPKGSGSAWAQEHAAHVKKYSNMIKRLDKN